MGAIKFLTLAMLAPLTGCASLGLSKPPEVSDISIANVFQMSKNDKAQQYISIKNTDDSSTKYDSIEALAFGLAEQAENTKSFSQTKNNSSERQKTLGALMIKASDDACYAYLTEISTYEKGTKSVLGSASILLAGAAGLATPVRSANLLSGLSAATQGIEEELGSTILGGLEADILVQAVRKGRGRQRKSLTDILNSDEKNAGFNMFIAEFSTYHDSCGISYGRDVIRDSLSSENNNEKPAPGEVRSLETITP